MHNFNETISSDVTLSIGCQFVSILIVWNFQREAVSLISQLDFTSIVSHYLSHDFNNWPSFWWLTELLFFCWSLKKQSNPPHFFPFPIFYRIRTVAISLRTGRKCNLTLMRYGCSCHSHEMSFSVNMFVIFLKLLFAICLWHSFS